MDRLFRPLSLVLVLLALGTAVYCRDSRTALRVTGQAKVLSDATLEGHWRLLGSNSVVSSTVSVPRILRLHVNSNRVRQADYCDMGGQRSAGAGRYELKNGTLTISYIGFRDAASRRRTDVPEDLEYTGKVTALTTDRLEIDGRFVYERYAPVGESGSGGLKVGICDTPPPTGDSPAPAGETDIVNQARTEPKRPADRG